MVVEGYSRAGVIGPRGPWTRTDQKPAARGRGTSARNVRFEPSRVKTRDGFSAGLAVSAKVTSLYHWKTNNAGIEINRLIFMEGSDVKMRDLIGATTTSLFTQSGRSIATAEAGSRLIVAVATTDAVGASKARIVNALIGGAPSDFAFAGPMTIVPAMSTTGAGSCSVGDHKFAYILETRSGFTGKPSPYTSGVFAPVTYTVAAGGKTLNMQVSGTMPSDAAFLHPIMTRRDNPNRWYFVPDGSVAVPAGAWTANISISVSDEDLADSAEEVSENFDYLTQDTGGSGPFDPFRVIEVGQRIAYLTPQKVYISDPQNYQVITEIEHAIQLPGQRRITTGFPLRGNFYMLGPSWTYGVSDNNDRPRLWGQPELVSGAIGTTGTNCVEWRTGGDYAWVANYSGLYYFNGQYDARPVSYMVSPEWNRINWGAHYAIQMRDDYVAQRLTLAVPLDGATEPTHMFVFDYSQGFRWTDIDFSLDNLPSTFSSVGLIQDRSTGRTELWVGPSAAGNILRQEAGLRSDNGAAINSRYETGNLLMAARGAKEYKIGGMELDVAGVGDLSIIVKNLNRTWTETPPALTLSAAFPEYQLIGTDINADSATVELATNAVGAYFDLSRVEILYVPWHLN